MNLARRTSMSNPDYYEVMEPSNLAQCDICKKDKTLNNLEVFGNPNYDVAILMCHSCYEKIENGEDLDE